MKIAARLNEAGCRLITIIGGEPMTVGHLPELVEVLLEIPGRRLNIDTNGTYLRSRWSESYKRIERFNITLDDLTASVHDNLRGGHRGVLDGIRFLQEKNVQFSGNVTLTELNYRGAYDTAVFLAESGATVVGFNAVKRIGRGEDVYRTLALSPAASEYLKDEILRFWEHFRSKVKVNVSGIYHPELFKRGVLDGFPSCLCGEYKAAIDAKGFVYPCESMPFLSNRAELFTAFGSPLSVLSLSLAEAAESALFVSWRDALLRQPTECQSCSFRLYCSGGCRAQNYCDAGSIEAKDGTCRIGSATREPRDALVGLKNSVTS